MKVIVAIDGPAAAGKSTVAKIVAQKLGFTYIDTGAMYRSVTLYALKKGIDPKDEEKVVALLDEITIDLKADNRVFLNGEDVTKEIRSIEVAANVSFVASYKGVRLDLVKKQRTLASKRSVVMDGRDIGSYVLPHADVKIFQIASIKERAKRRYEENISKGIQCTIEEIEAELEKRDYIDSHRSFAPLTQAADAYALDTSFMTVEEAADAVLDIINKKKGDING